MQIIRVIDPIILYVITALTLINIFCMALPNVYHLALLKHSIILILGFLMTLIITSYQSTTFLVKISWYLWIFGICCMIYLLIKEHNIKGAKRWFFLFGISIQPSEFVKGATVIIASNYVIKNQWQNIAKLYGITIFLLVLQPDFGNAILLSSIALIQLWIGHVPAKKIAAIGCIMLGVLIVIGICLPHVVRRVTNFFYTNDLYGANYQGYRALITLRSGDLLGKGIGQGTAKQLLPDAYSDFIFAVIGEELGLIGCYIIIILFLIFVCRILYKASKMEYSFEQVLMISCALMIVIQAWINIASATGLIPPKGITLPFISHGGSSLIISFWLLTCITTAMHSKRHGYLTKSHIQ